MRQIKFRGKILEAYETSLESYEKGDWIYGYFAMYNGVPNIVTQLVGECGGVGSGLIQCVIPIDRKTLSQYIGLNDKNKKEIYENDFVLQDDGEEVIYGWIEWDKDNARFQINDTRSNEQFCFDYDISASDLEIRGNKFDTPTIIDNLRDDRI